MTDAIHGMRGLRDGNDIDAFSDNSNVILNSNQAVFEPIDLHKLMTTGCNFD